ncbi:MAG TPA: hypothetical protein VMZ25_04160 [Terriglobales bacterium]|nr:hypothetical protein [Terriglobales bacterium]
MRKSATLVALGFAAGVVATFLVNRLLPSTQLHGAPAAKEVPATCYSCLWDGYGVQVRNDLIEFYRQYRRPDPLVMADVRYILWRASSNPNCDARQEYRTVAKNDADVHRRWVAYSILGMGARECGEEGTSELREAAGLAGKLGLVAEAKHLLSASRNELHPSVERHTIEHALPVPAGATTMVLGASKIEIASGMRIGAQVDRVARDWVSYQMNWDLSGKPFPAAQLLSYHEGAILKAVAEKSAVEVYPLTGTLIAKINGQWFAPDEDGRFRFNILGDKVQYPTTHERGDLAWIEDTHGVSALVEQAVERKMQMVVACGDSEGKAEAADYLSHKGIHVVFPGDRYQDLLLGYTGPGVLIGTAPVKESQGKTVIGGQPIRFALKETIVVEDTTRPFPMQYYDSAARYFRRLSGFVPLHAAYVLVEGPDEMNKVLDRARKLNATAVAVRVTTLNEAVQLRAWLEKSSSNRAILFHSGLYPYAQPLFRDFTRQVTFGDLRPRFE